MGFLWVYCVGVRSLKTGDKSPLFVFNFKPFAMAAVFKLMHEDSSKISDWAFIAFAAAALLVAWGIFIKLSQQRQTPGD